MNSISIDPLTTALVAIDLQKGIVGMNVTPHAASDIVQRTARLAARFREVGGTVVLVRVTFQPDSKDFLNPPCDAPSQFSPSSFPANWADVVPEVGQKEGDIVITKRQWGAFHGTELDLQLRRRGVKTIVLCGISTNIGVESTARSAFEHGYSQILVEDAMGSHSAEAHAFAVKNIFVRIGNVRTTEQVLAALAT
ncbi:MAG TPA: hydrolase [Opitutaceae bacterium]|jgi:nicotinamidase-related amidase|nr:hydrolase [Opitutaceae bacterium]